MAAHEGWLSPVATARDGVPSVTVEVGDIDLRDKAGVTELRHRISAAARVVCLQQLPADLTSSWPSLKSGTCEHATVESVDMQVRALVSAARSGATFARLRVVSAPAAR